MRLLNESQGTITLEQMGLRKRDYEAVKAEIAKPNGMILVVGTDGVGQETTTLYTILGMLNDPGVNISTLEDPVEYRMPRVNQSQINTKINFTFASGTTGALAPGPGYHHGGGDPRRRDGGAGGACSAHRAPGALDAPHQQRGRHPAAYHRHGHREFPSRFHRQCLPFPAAGAQELRGMRRGIPAGRGGYTNR